MSANDQLRSAKLAGANRKATNPLSKAIVRDANSNSTGILRDAAMSYVCKVTKISRSGMWAMRTMTRSLTPSDKPLSQQSNDD
jgi:predicted amidohydrolase YtcJ